MNDNIINLYSSVNDNIKDNFINNIDSNLKVKENSLKTTYDDTWLVKMEEVIRYLDNILRNPNRFIVNDEEIVKIELARRITVDSIKHLAKNTNLIQSFDEDTGEVRPSKILNINKEESFNTYENRFIYSLINNMKMYIEKKKKEINLDNSIKDDKSFVYQGKSKLGKESIDINVTLNSKLNNKSDKDDSLDLVNRISKVEEQIRDLCSSEVYKNLAKLHISLVTSPIKKTNLILKNTNFQYALELWNYLQSHMEDSLKTVKDNKDYNDTGRLKSLMDQVFLLNSLVIANINNTDSKVREDLTKEVVNTMVEELVNLNDKISLDELKALVGDQFTKVKYKKVLDTSEIERVYKEAIKDYVDKIDDIRIGKDE